MGSGRIQVSPPSRKSKGPKNGEPKSVTTASEEFRLRHPKEKVSFRKDATDHSQQPKSSFKIKPRSFLYKGTSEQKWQRAHMVVGALEVKSDPFLQPKEDMKPLYKNNDQGATASKFEDALQAWEDLDLRKSFTRACADLPDFVCCCGLSQSDNASVIKQYAALLNDGWVKHANSKIRSRGFKVDACIWHRQSSSGKSSSHILLVRFVELSTYKFRRASEEGSLDLDDMLLDSTERKNADDSSHYSASNNSSEDKPDR